VKKKRHSFTVYRRCWLRGEGFGTSMLLRSADDKLSCLGFACLQLGELTKDDIRDLWSPIQIQEKLSASPHGQFLGLIDNVYHLQYLNDQSNINDKVREERFKLCFLRHNVEVVFK
jgi:hypothetical protein